MKVVGKLGMLLVCLWLAGMFRPAEVAAGDGSSSGVTVIGADSGSDDTDSDSQSGLLIVRPSTSNFSPGTVTGGGSTAETSKSNTSKSTTSSGSTQSSGSLFGNFGEHSVSKDIKFAGSSMSFSSSSFGSKEASESTST